MFEMIDEKALNRRRITEPKFYRMVKRIEKKYPQITVYCDWDTMREEGFLEIRLIKDLTKKVTIKVVYNVFEEKFQFFQDGEKVSIGWMIRNFIKKGENRKCL